MAVDPIEQLVRERFAGKRVRLEPSLSPTVTVNTTATRVLPFNPNRVAWLIVNKSSNAGHADYENTVSTTQGFPVAQNGGSIESRLAEDGDTVGYEVWGINETASGTWYRRAWELY